MKTRLPPLALLLGIAGLVPFLAFGLLAVAPQGDRAGFALIAYGAVILAFLGGVHWGFALQDTSDRGERLRLGLGVLPSLIGWVALLLSVAVDVAASIGLLLLGFLATTVVEARGRSQGLVPNGYMRLRYGLSAVVVTVLFVVLLIRLTGAHVLLN